MTKLEVAALGVSALSVAAALFAISEARSATSGMGTLADRIAKVESAAPSQAPVAAGPTNADLARDIALLRAQVSALSAQPHVPATGPAATPAAAGQDAASKAAAEEEKRQQEWLNGLGKSIVTNLDEALDLSAQQSAQVTDLIRVQLTTMREIRLGKPADEAKKLIDALSQETNERIRQLLTAEQRTKFEEIANRPGGLFTYSVSSPKARPVDSPNGGGLQPK